MGTTDPKHPHGSLREAAGGLEPRMGVPLYQKNKEALIRAFRAK